MGWRYGLEVWAEGTGWRYGLERYGLEEWYGVEVWDGRVGDMQVGSTVSCCLPIPPAHTTNPYCQPIPLTHTSSPYH